MAPAPFFPDPRTADATGLVAVTDDMTPAMLVEAYGRGIFPWSDGPVRWYSPDPRAVFLPQRVHLPKNLGKLARRGGFSVTFDRAFTAVMQACADSHRQDGEWISPRFIATYSALHAQGHAHSVEVWQDDALVGGLYGIHLGAMFAGESMFHRVANASKVAFARLIEQLGHLGVGMLDAQVLNAHTASLGAVQLRRDDFLILLARAVAHPCAHAGKPWPTF